MDTAGHSAAAGIAQVFTLRNSLVIEDPKRREVNAVELRLLALWPTYAVTIDGEKVADVRKHFFTPSARG